MTRYNPEEPFTDQSADGDDTGDDTAPMHAPNDLAGGGGATIPAGELDNLRAERDALFQRLARAQADFQNSRKRLEAESDQRLQYANAQLLKSLLPVIDNLERAVAVDVNVADAASVMKGIQVVLDQFTKVLTTNLVESIIPSAGDPFDPTRHEALLQQQAAGIEPGHVTQLLQKGYGLKDRVLRPAQVAVAK